MKVKNLLAIFSLILIVAFAGCQNDPYLYDDDDDEDESAERSIDIEKDAIGLTYHLEKEINGESVTVSTESHFESGDKFRLVIEPQVDGYLYLFNLSSNGDFTRLYPQELIDGSAEELEAEERIRIPGEADGGWFRMNRESGIEIVYILFSQELIPDLMDTSSDSIGAGEFDLIYKELIRDQDGVELVRVEKDERVKLFLNTDKEDYVLTNKLTLIHLP